MRLRLFVYGLAAWIAGTLLLRFWGQEVLRPDGVLRIVVLFGATFPVAAWLVRRLCQKAGLPKEEWPAAAVTVLLPTLILDPFSSAFFVVMFPNMAPETAGVFGGWMLWCCAAGLTGATFGRHGA